MIVVTAPTSRIGRHLLPLLLAGPDPLRVVARDPARLPPGLDGRAEVVQGSHGDAGVIGRAVEGADAVFWLPVPDPAARSVEDAYVGFTRPAAEAFRHHGVGHVVGVSALGRGTPMAGRAGHVTASLHMDDLIAGTGVAYRALALPSFMDNLLWQADAMRTQGAFYGPIPAGLRAPTCSVGDIAAAAARLLLDRRWTGTGEVPVLGPEDLSFSEMADTISAVLGRPVRYQEIPVQSLQARLAGNGYSDAMAQAMADMMTAKAAGLDNAEPRTPEGTSPTSFRQWCEAVLKPAVTA